MSKTIIVCIALLLALASAEVPSYIHVCGRRNPNLDKCVLESVINLKDKLRSGIPELSVPSVEPLYTDEVALANLPNFKAFATNVTLHGLSQFDAKKLHVDLEKKSLYLEVAFKSVKLVADYDVNAKILVPVVGRGPIDIDAQDIFAKATLRFKLVNHNGKEYMYFSTMTTKLSIRDYTANFAPSDGPESPLATAINSALANARQEIIESTIPNLEKTITDTVLKVSNEICKHFTFDELFPDRE